MFIALTSKPLLTPPPPPLLLLLLLLHANLFLQVLPPFPCLSRSAASPS
jgi:hypothetical protein